MKNPRDAHCLVPLYRISLRWRSSTRWAVPCCLPALIRRFVVSPCPMVSWSQRTVEQQTAPSVHRVVTLPWLRSVSPHPPQVRPGDDSSLLSRVNQPSLVRSSSRLSLSNRPRWRMDDRSVTSVTPPCTPHFWLPAYPQFGIPFSKYI